jgi:hypothetical protein
MGLDISAYGRLKPAPHAELDSDGYPKDWEKFTLIRDSLIDFTERDFTGRTKGLSAGVFEPEQQHGFRAGSYIGYNQWRDHLARMAHGMSAEQVWSGGVESEAFLELINFSDCEGLIGPQVSAKLAQDFEDHEAKAEAYAETIEDGDWWIDRYRQWWRAFQMASDNGAVQFH